MAEQHTARNAALAFAAVPLLSIAGIFALVLTQDATAADAVCDPSGAAVTVNPATVPAGPIAGYDHAQLVNAAAVMLAAQRLGLTVRDQQIGVMTAMGESSLRVLNHGDAAGPDSRGLFQQRANGASGSLAERMDPAASATRFFRSEMAVPGRATMAPTLVAHAVQHNADPYHYEPWWTPAGTVVQALGGVQATANPPANPPGNPPAGVTSAPSVRSPYTLGPVQPQTATLANTLGPMFGIKTIGGWRSPAGEQYDPNGHPAGLALDFMINNVSDGKTVGSRLAAYLQAHAGDLGVKYVIWQQRIWSVARADEGWRPMADRGSPTANHMDHVHLSLTGAGPTSASPTVCGDSGAATVTQSGWAAPARGLITSGYGARTNPVTGADAFHYGIDIGAACQAPIYAANSGTVVIAGPSSGYGNLIELDHGSGVRTRYGHMYNDGVLVHPGDHVTAGQLIGRVGSNGRSTGCHLHFETLINGHNVNPADFLTKVGVSTTK